MTSVLPVAVDGLVKRYGAVAALAGVSVQFAAGKLTAILGPSGCGKTTLLRALAGFTAVEAGRIRFADDDVTAMPPQARGTAMVFQNYALWPHMTVFDNVAYGLRLKRVPPAQIAARVREALALVEIGNVHDVERRKPGALSGGQQQRVALARALVVEPRVLLLDEPLSNLDAKVRQRLRVEIRRLQRRVGITAIYVTHDQEEALAIADRIVLMSAGRVVQEGAPEEVYGRPATEFVADFLGVGTRLTGRTEAGVLHLLGQKLEYAGTARGPVVVILRASDLTLSPPAAGGDGGLLGQVEERLFLGSHYRHYVRIDGELVMPAPGLPIYPLYLVVPREAANRELATRYIDYIATPEVQARAIVERFGWYPGVDPDRVLPLINEKSRELLFKGVTADDLARHSRQMPIKEYHDHLGLAALLLLGAFRGVDESYLEAGRNFGAGTARLTRDVLVPMAAPAIAVSAILIFSSMLASFSIPLMMGRGSGPQMLIIDVYYRFGQLGDFETASALGVVSYLMAAGAALVYICRLTR